MDGAKSMSIKDFDWDDTILIQEYDRIMKASKKSAKKSKKSSEKKQSDKEEDLTPWQLDDYCRALYEEDGLFYEAQIVDIEYDVCTVEFYGYGDKAEVLLDSLKKSKGEKARRKQYKKATGGEENIKSHYSESEDSNLENKEVSTGPTQHHYTSNPVEYQYDPNAWRSHEYSYNDQSCQPYIAPSFVPPVTNNVTHSNESSKIPMPPLPCFVDSAMAAMLSSWYMAGYYTGLNQSKKTSQCQTSCNRPVSNCCHHH